MMQVKLYPVVFADLITLNPFWLDIFTPFRYKVNPNPAVFEQVKLDVAGYVIGDAGETVRPTR